MLHKLAIITVVYENYTVLKDFFESLSRQTNNNYKIFLVDLSNNKKSINYGRIPHQIIPSKNKGYSYGVNQGLKNAIDQDCSKFCVINDDTYFKDDLVAKSLIAVDKYPGSIIGGKIYYAQGFEYHKKHYDKDHLGKVIWYAGGTVDWNNALTPHRGVDEIDKGQYSSFEETDFVNGAFMLFDKKVIERVGFWDESYFLYFEDADFCVRAKRAGIKLYYDPSLQVWHKNSQSTEGVGSILHQRYQNENRLKFGLKYAPLKTKLHLLKNYFFNL